MEACSAAHHWARELSRLGHGVRLIPPQYVKPYVKRNKTDAADAEAICEAVVRPNMRFVPIKSIEQQAAMMLHRTRALLLRQRTQLINAVRGHLAEFGLVAHRGARNIRELAGLVRDSEPSALPDAARAMLILLLEQIREAQFRISQTETALDAWAKQSDACRRLMSIPGVVQCRRRHSFSRSTIPSAFARAVILPLGLDSCRNRARGDLIGSRREHRSRAGDAGPGRDGPRRTPAAAAPPAFRDRRCLKSGILRGKLRAWDGRDAAFGHW
jgi:hypothetical protein